MAGEGGEDDAQEKTHEATPRKIEKAREQGDLPRSQDAQTFAAYVGFAVAVAIAGGWMAEGLGAALAPAIAHPEALGEQILSGGGGETLGRLAGRVALYTLPILAAPAVVVIALLVAMRGVVVAPEKVSPKLSRLSLIQNAKQKFGPSGLVEFAKSTVKLLAVCAVLALALRAEADSLGQYADLAPRLLAPMLGEMFWRVMIGVLIVAAAIGAVDVVWQRLDHLRRLRMSHEEVKEETKQSEGDPHMRQTRRERARDIATNRMMHDVPEADVVVTNPTHVAVALRWDRASGSAPVCVAKGADEIALRIRAAAEEAGVPIHEDPPTARSIHGLVEVGHEIRPEHYRAVAAAILFADRLRGKAA